MERKLKGTHRIHATPDGAGKLTVRCRVAISKKFPFWRRIQFLFLGRMWVVTINGKEHTSVVLALRKPTDTAVRKFEVGIGG
jgi:hypothetical protein